MIRWKFNSQLHYCNQRVCTCMYMCIYPGNGTVKRGNLNSIQERVYHRRRFVRTRETLVSKSLEFPRLGLYANAPVSIPSPFYRRPHCYFACSSLSLHPPHPRAHVLPRLTFLRIMEPDTPNTLSTFINSPDKLIHEAGDGLINLPLPLHNDRWIARRGPS